MLLTCWWCAFTVLKEPDTARIQWLLLQTAINKLLSLPPSVVYPPYRGGGLKLPSNIGENLLTVIATHWRVIPLLAKSKTDS